MSFTVAQVLALIEVRKIQANPKYNGRYYQISGDSDALEYGANYCSSDLTVFRFIGRDGEGYETNKEYLSNWYAPGFDDLVCYFQKYGESCDIELDTEYGNVSECICNLLDAASWYGIGNYGYETGKNARSLLGFSPSRPWYPNDLFLVIE
jgi:hypothetical protein